MKAKTFSQFINEDISWNKGGPIADLLRRIASSAQDSGWNGYIGVSNDELEITADEHWKEEELDSGRDLVDCDVYFDCTIKPIFSEEYTDSSELSRLAELGLVEASSLIKGFMVKSSLSATCDEVEGFEYRDKNNYSEYSEYSAEDLSGGNSDLSDPEEFGSDLAETLNEWVNEYTFGGYYKVAIEKALNEYCANPTDDEDE